MKLIDKSALVAEIDTLQEATMDKNGNFLSSYDEGKFDALAVLEYILDTLEVKNMDTWHLQEKENIYDAVNDWSLQTFVCIMKDGTIQKFTGNLDEDCKGHIHIHIYGANDDYDNVDDIVKWIELT
jgi:hypothetical protein